MQIVGGTGDRTRLLLTMQPLSPPHLPKSHSAGYPSLGVFYATNSDKNVICLAFVGPLALRQSFVPCQQFVLVDDFLEQWTWGKSKIIIPLSLTLATVSHPSFTEHHLSKGFNPRTSGGFSPRYAVPKIGGGLILKARAMIFPLKVYTNHQIAITFLSCLFSMRFSTWFPFMLLLTLWDWEVVTGPRTPSKLCEWVRIWISVFLV